MFTGTVLRGPVARAFNKFAVGDVLLFKFLVSDTESATCVLACAASGRGRAHARAALERDISPGQ
jgi:hypothetical protein